MMTNETKRRLEGKMAAQIKRCWGQRNTSGWKGDRNADPARRVVRSSVAVIRAIRAN